MMEEWEEIKIKDFCEFKYGKNLPAEKRIPGSYPVFGSSGITGWHNDFLIEGPGIIIGRKGTVGKVQFSKDNFFPIDTTYYVSEDTSKVDLKYLYYRLPLCGLEGMNSDAAIPGLSRSAAINLKIKLPPLPTQRKIAAILSAYDDLIENNLKSIKLLEEKAQLTFEEWFVRMKFPGHETTPINEETVLPEGWEKGNIKKLFELQRGFDLPIQSRKNGSIPILASTGVTAYHNVAKVKGPGVVTGRSGTIGEVQFIIEDFWPLNTTLWVKKYNRANPAFTLQFLRIINLKRFAGGSAVPSLDRKVVHNQTVKIPPKEIIANYGTLCDPILRSIQSFENQNQLLIEAKDILLPRLMTGMIDVEDLDLSAFEAGDEEERLMAADETGNYSKKSSL